MNELFHQITSLRDALQETVTHLRLSRGGCLLIAVAEDDHVRKGATAGLVEQLYDLLEFEEYVFDLDYPSLAAYLETLSQPKGPALVVAHGLDLLPPHSFSRAIRLLNLEREALQRDRWAILLWVRSETLPSIIHQAGDFWAWRSTVLEFDLPPGVRIRLGPSDYLPVRELARLYRFKDAFELQLDSAIPSAPSTADLRLQLAEVYRQLGFPGRQVMELRRTGLALKVKAGDIRAQVEAYNQFVADRYASITVYSPTAGTPVRVELDRLYVTLTTKERVARRERTDRQTGPSQEREVLVERVLAVPEALAERSRLVIVGAPGSGKTILLQWIALTVARGLAQVRLGWDDRRVPILIPLRALAKYIEGRTDRREPAPACLLEFLEEYFSGWRLSLPEGFFAGLVEEGRAVFLLDGLDEIADLDLRADATRAVQMSLAHYAGNYCVVTSRPSGCTRWSWNDAGFSKYEIRPLSDQEVEAFVTDWSVVTETAVEDTPTTRQRARDNANALLQRIWGNEPSRRLVETLLHLAMTALVHHSRAVLPRRRAELYGMYTKALLDSWDMERDVGTAGEFATGGELDGAGRRAMLESVALHIHERRQVLVDPDDLSRWLREGFSALGDPQPELRAELLATLAHERVGLLMESSSAASRFSHLSLQQYMAARAVADRVDYITYTLARRRDPWWRELILLQVSHLSRPPGRRTRRLATELVRAIWQEEEEDPLERHVDSILRRNLLLAGSCLADLGPMTVEPDVRDWIVTELGETLRTTPYGRLRGEAARVLAELGGSGSAAGAAQELVRALTESGAWRVRQMAASALGRLGESRPDVIGTLVKALAKDHSWQVRQTVATSLGWLDNASPEIEKALVGVLSDGDWQVRQAAISSLNRLQLIRPDLASTLVEAVADEEWSVRQAAVSGLGQLGDAGPEVVRALTTALADDERLVRQAAASGLGKVTEDPHEVTEALIEALSDDESIVRQAAVSSLGRLGKPRPEVVDALLGALTDNEVAVRRAAVSSLGHLGETHPGVVEALSEALAGDQWLTLQATASRLTRLTEDRPVSVAPLIGEFTDEGSPSSGVTVSNLGRLSTNDRRMILRRLLRIISGLKFEEQDIILGRSAQDYAFDTLWAIAEGLASPLVRL